MPIYTIKQKFQQKPASGDTYRKLTDETRPAAPAEGLGGHPLPTQAAWCSQGDKGPTCDRQVTSRPRSSSVPLSAP